MRNFLICTNSNAEEQTKETACETRQNKTRRTNKYTKYPLLYHTIRYGLSIHFISIPFISIQYNSTYATNSRAELAP
jgi:hypothetical protein